MDNKIIFENCQNIKVFKSPYSGEVESIEFLTPISSLPDKNEVNFETNPRKQNLKTKTFQKIESSLLVDDHSFHKKNKGMVFTASEAVINSQKNTVTVKFEDANCHGLCDGAHSYMAALKVLEKAEKTNFKIDHYMKIEVMLGIEDIFEDVVAARNSSVQVSDSAIAELKEQFSFIKEFLQKEPFAEKISFKDNEISDISIKDIIAVLFEFNIDRYPDDINCPTQSFNASSSCLNDFLSIYKNVGKNDDIDKAVKSSPYYRMKNVMVDFFKLYDEIELKLPYFYNKSTKKHLAKLSCIKKSEGKTTTFYNKPIDCIIPKAFILPILGSFRAILQEDADGFYAWSVDDPIDFLNKYGPQLASEIVERYIEIKSTTSLGRNLGVWRQLYRIVQMKYILEYKK